MTGFITLENYWFLGCVFLHYYLPANVWNDWSYKRDFLDPFHFNFFDSEM